MQKARQAARSGSGWLRVDVLDGMWQFTPWAGAGLRAKIGEIAPLVQLALDQAPESDGAVLTSGAFSRRVSYLASQLAPRRTVTRCGACCPPGVSAKP
jgi:hypothetical protein